MQRKILHTYFDEKFFVRRILFLDGNIPNMPRWIKFVSRKKKPLILTRDFFVRQFKALEGYILICREGFGLYHGKRNL